MNKLKSFLGGFSLVLLVIIIGIAFASQQQWQIDAQKESEQ